MDFIKRILAFLRPKQTQAQAIAERLNEIAVQREWIKMKIARAKKSKKAHKHLWVQLRDLTNEEDALRGSK